MVGSYALIPPRLEFERTPRSHVDGGAVPESLGKVTLYRPPSRGLRGVRSNSVLEYEGP